MPGGRKDASLEQTHTFLTCEARARFVGVPSSPLRADLAHCRDRGCVDSQTQIVQVVPGPCPGPCPVHTAQQLSTGACGNVSIMTSNAHAPVLGTGTSKVFRMSRALEERDRKRKLWDSQYVSEVFKFVGSRLKDP